MIVEDITAQLNSLVQTANGEFKFGNQKIFDNSMTKLFLNSMAKGIVRGVGNIIEDITNTNN